MGYTPFVPSFFTEKSDCDQSRHITAPLVLHGSSTYPGGASFPQQCDPRTVVSGIRRHSAGWRCRQVEFFSWPERGRHWPTKPHTCKIHAKYYKLKTYKWLWTFVTPSICPTNRFFSVSNPSRDAEMQKGGTPNEQQIGHRNAHVQGHASHVWIMCMLFRYPASPCKLDQVSCCVPSTSAFVPAFVFQGARFRSGHGKGPQFHR